MNIDRIPKHFKQVLIIQELGYCLIWQLSTNYQGHGRAVIKELGKNKQTHHVMWYLKYGYWPSYLCHKCNQPACGEVEHLYEGNSHTNAIDMREAGTTSGQKLTMEIANEIRNEYKWHSKNSNSYALSRKYGVNQSQIIRIINNQIWV